MRDRYGNHIYLTQERWEPIIKPMNHPAMLYYGQASNTLYISFAPSMHATGIELTDHILLRVNKQECRAVGITLLEYSVLAQQTDMGLHSFLLIGFDHLPTAIS